MSDEIIENPKPALSVADRVAEGPKIPHLDYGFVLALILPIFAIMPLLTHAGLPNTADGPVHLMRQVELNQAWQEGNLYPRWGTDLAYGHGMPIFSYAPPSLYQLTQLFHLTGLPLDEAMKAVLVFNLLLYSLGMYLFARRSFGPAPALAAAAMYVYAPYRLREAYIQGNYGQFTGLAFYPLICWAFHGLITEGRSRYLIAAALSLAGLLLSHNISSMLFAPLLVAYLLFLLVLNWRARPNRTLMAALVRPALRTMAGGLLGLGLAAIFWLPAFGERHDIKLEGITRGFFDFRENFIALSEFLSPPVPLDLAAINPEFPLSLGLPQIIGAALGIISLAFFFIIIRKPTSKPPAHPPNHLTTQLLHTLFFALCLLLYAFLAVPYSQTVWEAVPLLDLAEFPWRMLGPALFCASFLAAPALTMVNYLLSKRFPQRANRLVDTALLVTILLIIALNAHYLYPAQFIPWGTPTPADAFTYEAASGAIGTTSTGEFLPRTAQQHPEPDTLWPDYAAGRPPQILDPATLPAGATVTYTSHRAESDTIEIDTPEAFTATLRTLYWPGWQLYLNGRPLPFDVTPETGLIQTTIPSGQHNLTLQLESTPLRAAGLWLTILSAFSLLAIAASTLKERIGQIPNQPTPDSYTAIQPSTLNLHPSGISPKTFALLSLTLAFIYLLSRPLAPLFTLQSDPNRPQPADRTLQVDFGRQLRLVGMDALPQDLHLAGEDSIKLTVTLYWRALDELAVNYSVFLHLDAPNGQTMATVDERHPENIPTRNWPPGLYLRNPLHLEIPADVPPIRYDLNVGVYDPESGQRLPVTPGDDATFTLGSIWLVAPPPPVSQEPLARFGPNITLYQANAPSAPDQTLTMVWQTGQPLDQNYSIFVHLLDADGNLIGQLDGAPYNGLYPLPNWQPGRLITDARPLPPLTDFDQLNAIAVGIYLPETGERLPAANSRGQSLPNNTLLIPVTP